MGQLFVNIGTVAAPNWVPVASGGSSGGGSVADVMWVGPDAPADPATELWYDTDEPAVSASVGALGIVAVGQFLGASITIPAGVGNNQAGAPLVVQTTVGRRYRLRWKTRATRPSVTTTPAPYIFWFQVPEINATVYTLDGTNAVADVLYRNEEFAVDYVGDGQTWTITPMVYNNSATAAFTLYTDLSSWWGVEDMGPVTPGVAAPLPAGPRGVIAIEGGLGVPNFPASATTRLFTFNNVPLETGRMYEIVIGVRAIRSQTTAASSARFVCNSTGYTGPGSLIVIATGTAASIFDWWTAVPANSATYGSVYMKSALFTPTVTGLYSVGVDIISGTVPITVWVDTTPIELRDMGPAQSVWP